MTLCTLPPAAWALIGVGATAIIVMAYLWGWADAAHQGVEP